MDQACRDGRSRLPLPRSLVTGLPKNVGKATNREIHDDASVNPWRGNKLGKSQISISNGQQIIAAPGIASLGYSAHRREVEAYEAKVHPNSGLSLPSRPANTLGPELESSLKQSERSSGTCLSGRAAQSLSRIPPSPSPRRRKSGFFPDEPPAQTPRKAANLGSISYSSRSVRGSGHSAQPPVPAASPVRIRDNDGCKIRPKTTVSSTLNGCLDQQPLPTINKGPKTIAHRSSRERSNNRSSSLLLDVPSRPAAENEIPHTQEASVINPTGSAMKIKAEAESSTASRKPHSAKPIATNKCSQTLRETIAKAKAAQRRTREATSCPSDTPVGDDPVCLDKRFRMAVEDGRLNIAGLGLQRIPSTLLSLHTGNTLDFCRDGALENLTLIKFNAADNIIDELQEEFFPSEDCTPRIVASLESLDLHGNVLKVLPAGLRNLELLTVLNLSRNLLDHSCLATITKLPDLRELYLSGNRLEGILEGDKIMTEKLEILDLSSNNITSLEPSSPLEYPNMRKLLLHDNRLTKSPFQAINASGLIELDIASNRISGTLLGDGTNMPLLRVLNASCNALTQLSGKDVLHLPELQILRADDNRLQALPSLAHCSNIMTLSASSNSISEFPRGMAACPSLANVDLSRNALRKVDKRIGLMEKLTSFNITHNPMPQRRLLTMATDRLKQELRQEIEALQEPAEIDKLDHH